MENLCTVAKVAKGPGGYHVPGGAAVTHPAKVMLERRLAGPQRLGLLCRSAATGVAIPLLASVGWGGDHGSDRMSRSSWHLEGSLGSCVGASSAV